jgi:hypothetical protein
VDWHHPKEDLVKFGYRSKKQVVKFGYRSKKQVGEKKFGILLWMNEKICLNNNICQMDDESLFMDEVIDP